MNVAVAEDGIIGRGHVHSGKPLTQAEQKRIVRFRLQGLSITKISKETGHHTATIGKYLNNMVDGCPLTPLRDRVASLRNRMIEAADYDITRGFAADMVLIDEYRERMAENVATGSVPGVTDAGEIKKIVEARAMIARLPGDLAMQKESINNLIHARLRRQQKAAPGGVPTDFEEIGDGVAVPETEDEGETSEE